MNKETNAALSQMNYLAGHVESLVEKTGGKSIYAGEIQDSVKKYQEILREHQCQINSEIIKELDDRMCNALEKLIYPPKMNN